MKNSDTAILITVLRCTSSLLGHYGYSGNHPNLCELQNLLSRAIANLEDADLAARPPVVTSSREHLESKYQ